MNTKKRVKKIIETKHKVTNQLDKKSLKSTAYENPDRDDDLKEYLNRKDFHPFELELLMDDSITMDDSQHEDDDDENWS